MSFSPDEEAVISLIGCAADRLEVVDPGYVRSRRGVRAVSATVLAWATMLAVTSVFDVTDPLRITLFAAGAAFEGALLAPDPQPRDRLRTLGWAAVVCAAAVVATVQLSLIAVWIAAMLLVLLMFSSYALRAWSPRVASLALMGAITVYVTGGGHITVGRIVWFVLAAAIGFAWLAVWESSLLPDDPLRSLQRSVQAFCRRTAETVAGVAGVLDRASDGGPTDRTRKALHAKVTRVQVCRDAIERQYPGAIVAGLSQADMDGLRVALHSAQKGLEDMVAQVHAPQWTRLLPAELRCAMTDAVHALSVALRDDDGDESRAAAVHTAHVLRTDIHDALTRASTSGAAPLDAMLASLTLLGGGELVARSIMQARTLASKAPQPTGGVPPATSVVPATDPTSHRDRRRSLSPTMALAIQAVVAAVAAGVIARTVGNEQSLVVAWTAFVIIAGSAGMSTRRAMVRIPATILGAVSGVLMAATVPNTVTWTIAVVAVGVFFTIVSAPVSYPAMVFWMSIAFVPLFASEGRYLDLIWDKAVAALIGGCVAAVVALTIVPIRSTREVRPAILEYLTALDAALASQLPRNEAGVAAAEAELDSAHAALAAKVAAAATETNVFAQLEHVGNDEADLVDAVHDAYLQLTPLLSDSSRLLHGWSDDRVAHGLNRLREAVARAALSARGEVMAAAELDQRPTPNADYAANLGLSDSVHRVERLQIALTDLATALGGSTDLRHRMH